MSCLSRMMLTMSLAVAVAGSGQAQDSNTAPATSEKVIPLYLHAALGLEKWDWKEREVTTPSGMPMVQDVVRPVLLHYPAEKCNAIGTAMIVAPGGGFRTLMMSYEGKDVAKRLNAMGTPTPRWIATRLHGITDIQVFERKHDTLPV
jgi:hypothetical protein